MCSDVRGVGREYSSILRLRYHPSKLFYQLTENYKFGIVLEIGAKTASTKTATEQKSLLAPEFHAK
jgi:hypothetical protein